MLSRMTTNELFIVAEARLLEYERGHVRSSVRIQKAYWPCLPCLSGGVGRHKVRLREDWIRTCTTLKGAERWP